jgi:hypothetical protein
MCCAMAIAACGSTAPARSAPSAVAAPVFSDPSLVGNWYGTNGLVLIYRDSNTQALWACHVEFTVRAQTAGTFSGFVSIQGGNDKECTSGFAYTAQMTADGTITSFSPDRPFVTSYCTPVSDATFTGTASNTTIRVQMKDRATCDYGAGSPRDTDRTFTIAVDRRSATMALD